MTGDEPVNGGHLSDALSGLIDGELRGPERAAAERHLSLCAACRAELDSVARVHRLVARLPVMAVPPERWSDVRAPGYRRPKVLVRAGAAAAVVGLSLLAAFPSQHRVTPQMAHLVRQHASFVSVAVGSGSQDAAPASGRDGQQQWRHPTSLPAPFSAPGRLAADYSLVSVVGHKPVVEAVYTDGLHMLSVFEEGGGLNGGHLPPTGDPVIMGTVRGVRYGWPGGQLITWQAGQATFTLVGDGPVADLVAAGASLPAARNLSISQRVRLDCRQMLDELTGRR